MIKDIKEINLPDYATLSQATVTLNDMGDKTISTQVKIDGNITPDFSFDWELEFKGERYIHPLREPQASKGNDSICSLIDLTFYHKTIYDLKRYYFPKMAEVSSGTVSVDKYIADLNVNLEQFKVALQEVLNYYHKIGYLDEPITVKLYGEGEDIYAKEAQYVQIQYTHIWDVIQKMHDLFGVRWSIEGRTLRIGYPAEEVAHTFEYGFEGGLLRVERQVQSADIRNSLLGRGGSKNLPYRYFKDTDPQNPSFQADPDWIPELANIYFSELRGKTFRDYVKGWKAKHYGGEAMAEPTEAYTKGYTDAKFNPVEYVEDKDSIAKYGLLQGGLENQEDIYPSIQGVEVEPYGRIDEVVEAEQVLVDDTEEPTSQNIHTESIDASYSREGVAKGTKSLTISVTSPYFTIPEGFKGGFLDNISVSASANYWFQRVQGNSKQGILWDYRGTSTKTVLARVTDAQVYEVGTNNRVTDIAKLSDNTKYLYVASVEIYGDFPEDEEKRWKTADGSTAYDNITIDNTYTINVGLSWELDATTIPSLVVGNYTDGIDRIYGEIKDLAKNSEKSIDINSEVFTVPASGATMVDAPINIIATDSDGNDISGTYEWEKSVKLVNTATNEVLSSINIPQGEYYARVNVRIKNNHTTSANYRIELLPSYVYFPIDTAQWQPTFDIWVKNIWGTTRNEGESAEAYAERVWRPILGDREGNEAKVVFTTGWLSGHSDYEFTIVDVAYANDVPDAEWRLTLAKSDAELEATGVYIPSTTQQANKGDHFFFIGIDMPHQYTLWAEERLDNYKRDQLLDTAHIKPTWVVQTDKVRLNQLQEGESELLLNAFKVGNSILLADTRFVEGAHEKLYLQSITYTWGADTHLLPNVEVVLSDKIATVTNPVQQIQGEIDTLTKQVGSLSNMQQVIRAIGDKLYLRKDGIEELCKSPVEFLQTIASKGFRQGIVGGKGWSVYTDANGNATIECDVVKARQDLQVNNIVANQVTAVGGKQIESAASIVCSRVDATEQGFVCYFDTHNGSIRNLFQVGDVAYSQVFSPDNMQAKSYKREVVAVSEDSITLSIASNGEGLPQVGDVIVHYGSTTDTSRQYVIIRDVIGGGYERMLSGLNSVSASGEEYYFAGRLEGSTPRWFVGNKSQYIEYKDGHLQINADVTLGGGSDLSDVEEFQQVKQDAESAKETADNALASAKSYTDEVVKDLQDQLDGKVESFFYDYNPTLDNLPASEWIANGTEEEHLNDTFTNTTSGRSWRWLEKGGVYQWVEIADTQSAEALAKAQEALGVANGKVTVFVEKPMSPYKVKDLWLQGTDGRIKRCVKTRTTTGNWYAADWVDADDSHEYTDSKLASYKAEVTATVEALDNAIAAAETNAKNYTDAGKEALQANIDALNNAKANIEEVYTKAEADDQIGEAEANAIAQAQALADAAQAAAEATAEAYADGKVTAEEEARLQQAQQILAEAQAAMAKANAAMEEAEAAKSQISAVEEDLKKQIDGKVESYFETDDATKDTISDAWTAEEKASHEGDTYTNVKTGKSWKWKKDVNGLYQWEAIADTATEQALANAAKAQETADGKRTIYYQEAQPEPPYDKGDLWAKGEVGQLKVCTTTRAKGEDEEEGDWVVADDSHSYTDTEVQKAIEAATDAINNFIGGAYAEKIDEIQAQLDQKAETWYEVDDPSTDWESDADKTQHKGDLWYKDGKSYTWSGDSWVESDVPQAVYDKIDGKAEIFTSKPTSYHKNDMWVLEEDYSLYMTGFKQGVVVFAKENRNNDFFWIDWSLKVSYTDDTMANAALTAAQEANNYIANTLPQELDELQDQLDGKVESFFNANAEYRHDLSWSWDTSGKSASHEGDTFTHTTSGQSWRWLFKDEYYQWVEITDAKATEALQAAAKAQDTADGKRRVFVEQPTPPYDVRDLWTDGTDLYRCKTAKADVEKFSRDDWELATKYTTETKAEEIANNAYAEAIDYIDKAVGELKDQLDGKVESFFYEYDPTLGNLPASEWIANGTEEEHLNDTFTNTTSGRSWRWLEKDGSYQWVEIADTQSAEALAKAQEALGVANSKVAVFVTEDTPKAPYNEGDFWLNGSDLLRSKNSRTVDGATYPDDWVKATDYTNDDAANAAQNAADKAQGTADEAKAEAEAARKELADIQYLKNAFGSNAVVLDVNGVTVSTFIGVKDTIGATANIVAGLYGGGSPILNDNGWYDPDKEYDTGTEKGHGTLMIWAGADNAQDPTTATTRIYEDGTIYTNKLIATNADISGKIVSGEGEIGGFEIDGNSLEATALQTLGGNIDKMFLSASKIKFTDTLDGVTTSSVYIGFSEGIPGNDTISSPIVVKNIYNNAHSNYGARITAKDAKSFNIALWLSASSEHENAKNYALDVEQGDIFVEQGRIIGLRPNISVVTSGGILSPSQNIVLCNNASAMTLTLPSSAYIGQMYIIRRLTPNANVTIKAPSGSYIVSGSRSMSEAVSQNPTITLSNYHAVELHYAEVGVNKIWVANYMAYNI